MKFKGTIIVLKEGQQTTQYRFHSKSELRYKLAKLIHVLKKLKFGYLFEISVLFDDDIFA